jgi:hypothetical protein
MTAEQMSGTTGPYLTAALICEKVLQEKDNVASAIRIIDRLTHTIRGPHLPEELPKVNFQFVIFISLKAGAARGRHQLEVISEHPSGQRNKLFSTSVLFEGEERGNNLVVQAGMEFDAEGLYWYDVMLEGQRLTRIPFRMLYQLVSTGTQ